VSADPNDQDGAAGRSGSRDDEITSGGAEHSWTFIADPRFHEGESEVQPGSGSVIQNLPPFVKDQHDATTRRWLAFLVLGVVTVLYGAAVAGVLFDWITAEELGEVALVLGPTQALAAAVLGFYFGQEQSK
jgi:hypothetical protein